MEQVHFMLFPPLHKIYGDKYKMSSLLLTKPSVDSWIPHSQNWKWNWPIEIDSLLGARSEKNQPIRGASWCISQSDDVPQDCTTCFKIA